MAEEELTAEAKKQRRKREKAAAKDAALGVEKFTVEVAGGFQGRPSQGDEGPRHQQPARRSPAPDRQPDRCRLRNSGADA